MEYKIIINYIYKLQFINNLTSGKTEYKLLLKVYLNLQHSAFKTKTAVTP